MKKSEIRKVGNTVYRESKYVLEKLRISVFAGFWAGAMVIVNGIVTNSGADYNPIVAYSIIATLTTISIISGSSSLVSFIKTCISSAIVSTATALGDIEDIK